MVGFFLLHWGNFSCILIHKKRSSRSTFLSSRLASFLVGLCLLCSFLALRLFSQEGSSSKKRKWISLFFLLENHVNLLTNPVGEFCCFSPLFFRSWSFYITFVKIRFSRTCKDVITSWRKENGKKWTKFIPELGEKMMRFLRRKNREKFDVFSVVFCVLLMRA